MTLTLMRLIMAHVSSSSYEQLGVSFMLCEPAKIGFYSREGGERIGSIWRFFFGSHWSIWDRDMNYNK